MSRFGDEEIRAFFDEARRADQAAAPALKRVLERPRRARSFFPVLAAGLAAAALLAGALVVRWMSSEPSPPSALSAWRSPTEFLLRPALSDPARLAPRLDGEGYPSSALLSFGPKTERERPRPAQ